MRTVSEREMDWLRELHDKLWVDEWQSGGYGSGYVSMARNHQLSDEEWARIQRVVGELSLPVCMMNTRFGFGVSMVIHEPEREWVYPGVEVESRPPMLAMVSQGHLPGSQCSGGGVCSFDDGWRCFEPMTHSEANLELLRRCQLPLPKSKGDYVY